ncbi:hypothetical protein NW763_011623 [Fusarium oxysporum]|nr:hypothetical protein NW763_011623 [Fusarium oxysporum]
MELPSEDQHRNTGQEIDQHFEVIEPLGCLETTSRRQLYDVLPATDHQLSKQYLKWQGIRQTRRKLCIAWADCRMMQMRQVQDESRCRSNAAVDLFGSIGVFRVHLTRLGMRLSAPSHWAASQG